MQLSELSIIVPSLYWARDQTFQLHGLSQRRCDLTGAVGEGAGVQELRARRSRAALDEMSMEVFQTG